MIQGLKIICFFSATIQLSVSLVNTKFKRSDFCIDGNYLDLSYSKFGVVTKSFCSSTCAVRDDCLSFTVGNSQFGATCYLYSQVPNDDCSLISDDHKYYVKQVSGVSKEQSVPSCEDLKALNAPSGTYWLDVDGGSPDNAFQGYCDMDTDGGGWTLVYSYGFNNYDNFGDATNVLDVAPNWAVTIDMPISTTAPINEHVSGALDFSLWSQIGERFLIKSDVNHWIACDPAGGSFIGFVSGTLNCQMIKSVGTNCPNLDVSTLRYDTLPFGPCVRFGVNRAFYLFCALLNDYHYAAHEPCGYYGQLKQVPGLTNPRGAVYVKKV